MFPHYLKGYIFNIKPFKSWTFCSYFFQIYTCFTKWIQSCVCAYYIHTAPMVSHSVQYHRT